jgi:hypothetical protein
MSRTDKDAPSVRKSWFSGPPSSYVNLAWTVRERQAVRIDCLNAIKEYRHNGKVDTVPTICQHHHGVRSMW